MLALVLEILFEVLFSGGLEFLLELFDGFNRTRENRAVAILSFLGLGILGGLVTGFLAPHPVLSPWLFPGVSLLILPAFLALLMNAWGHLRSERSKTVSHLATWYGGAAMGLGLAAGRLLVLALTRKPGAS